MALTQLLSCRLVNQRLTSSTFAEPAQVVRWFGAVQSQDYEGAKWALAQRMPEAGSADIEAAFNAGEILRTHVMRPTWHFVAPDDIRWLLKLTSQRVKTTHGSNFRKFEIDDLLARRTNRALVRALKGGKHLTRPALREVINRIGIDVSDPLRFAHILLHAELDGVICSGAREGNQFTYALLDERVSNEQNLTHDESLAELTTRYFNSHGPATLNDFMWWSGLTAADAKRGLEMVSSSLEQIRLEGRIFFCRDRRCDGNFATAHLLPAFDEYLVAYRERKELMHFAPPQGINNFWLGPAILVAGRVVGGWKRVQNKGVVTIELSPFSSLNRKQKSLVDDAVGRYQKFRSLGADTHS